MAFETDVQLTTRAEAIRDETTFGAITKTEVYELFKGIIDSKSEILIEADASGGVVDYALPLANTNEGQIFTIIKIDGSANEAAFVRSGANLISGQTRKAVDVQWSGYRVRSNGVNYTVIGLI